MQEHAHAVAGNDPAIAFRRGGNAKRAKGPGRALGRLVLLSGVVALIAGCSRNSGSFDVDDSSQTKWNNLVALVQFKPLPNQPKPTDPIVCPEIQVLDGTAADRIYASGSGDQSNMAVRYQFSLGDVARDCNVSGGQVAMKVGVEGRILLGPAGAPGAYVAPIRVAIIRLSDQEPVVSKLYKVGVNVPDGQSEAPFTFVTEPLAVPVSGKHFAQDYTIKVGFDSASSAPSDAGAAHHRHHAPAAAASPN